MSGWRLRPRRLAEILGDEEAAERLMREAAGRQIPGLPATHERNQQIRRDIDQGATYREAGARNGGLSPSEAYDAANGRIRK
jgi:hypothetical protein